MSENGPSRNHPHILDMGQLFLYSGLVDQVRDTAAFFVVNNVEDREAVLIQVRQYHELRTLLTGVLTEQAATGLESWAPELCQNTVSAASLHTASATLARYLDLLHQTPQFLVQHKIVSANAAKAAAQIDADEDEGEAAETESSGGAPQSTHPGTYL